MKQASARFAPIALAFAFAFGLLAGTAQPAFAEQQDPPPASEHRTVRVAWPDQPGLTEVDENGVYSGYTYEYLEQIAQFTGWDYEFVHVEGDINSQLVTFLGMLETGDVDIVGAMSYSDALAQLYDYAINPYGTAHTSLLASDGNYDITDVNIYQQRKLRVAFLGSSTKSTAAVQAFCDMNGIELEHVECGSADEQVEAVLSGRADVLTGVDISPEKDMHVVASLTPNPFYFATTKGNQDIVSSLNEAIVQIEKSDPTFGTELYEKHFNSSQKSQGLSKDLRAFVAQSDTVRVGYLAGAAPIQDFDDVTGEPTGASKTALDFIATYTGLSIEYVPIPSPDDWSATIEQYDLDVIVGIARDAEFARTHRLSLSTPYLSSYQCLVVRDGADASDLDGQRLAVSKGAVGREAAADNVLIFETIEDCIKAVSAGDADYTYAEGFTSSYLINTGNLNNVTSLVNADVSNDLCFAFSPDADSMLLRAFNEAIREMPAGTVSDSVYREILQDEQITVAQFAEAYAKEIAIGGVLVIIVVALTALYVWSRSKALATTRAEKERLEAIAEQDGLTGLLSVGALRERAHELAARKEIGGFVVIDIDDFKDINDTYGHKAGDEALCMLARTLEEAFRENDAISRFGGDEFAVCLKGPISKEALKQLCETLVERVRTSSIAQGRPFTVSVGAFRSTEGDEGYLDLYDCADKAMYEAKRSGKGRFAIA